MRISTCPWTVLPALIVLAACGHKEEGKTPDHDASKSAGATVTATGKVITVNLVTDEKGSRFEPATIEAHRGDMVRFTLGVGVHNVHFLADSNAGATNLPEASEMLQLPGQTYDLLVSLAANRTYYFQCDPHAVLGMIGHLKVE